MQWASSTTTRAIFTSFSTSTNSGHGQALGRAEHDLAAVLRDRGERLALFLGDRLLLTCTARTPISSAFRAGPSSAR
jgi:hypothetical protein